MTDRHDQDDTYRAHLEAHRAHACPACVTALAVLDPDTLDLEACGCAPAACPDPAAHLADLAAGAARWAPVLVAATTDFGIPTASKRGRDPRWPYVPVIRFTSPHGDRQAQVLGRAYATPGEALVAARAHIAHQRAVLARKLADRRHRALREAHGLPRELG